MVDLDGDGGVVESAVVVELGTTSLGEGSGAVVNVALPDSAVNNNERGLF